MREQTESTESGTDTEAEQLADRVFRPASASQDESISLRVVEALAEAKDRSPMELDAPLYETVDPEALERIFEPNDGNRGRVVFTVDEYEVTVTADRDIYVRRIDSGKFGNRRTGG